MQDKIIRIGEILCHYFKLGLKDGETSLRNCKMEGNEAKMTKMV